MKPWKEVIDGIRNAVLGKEVREDIAQMGEYVEQFANTAGENIQKAIDPTLSLSGKAADAKVTGDAIGELKGDLAEMSSNKKYNELYCTIEGVLSVNGTDLQSSKYMRTDYIDVSGYEEYKYIGNV